MSMETFVNDYELYLYNLNIRFKRIFHKLFENKWVNIGLKDYSGGDEESNKIFENKLLFSIDRHSDMIK